MESTTQPRVGVTTVSYNSESVLSDFLSSIPLASTSPLHVVVADNHPEAGGETERITRAGGAEWLPMPENLGYGAGMNAAAGRLPESVEWILVSNPDIVLHPGAIDTLVAAAESDPLIAAVGPAIENDDGSRYPSARAVPSLRTGVGHAMFVNLWPDNPWTSRYRSEDVDPDAQRDTGWLSGSCLLVRRSAFDAIGGFDDGYFMYFEDVDLGYRFGKAGWRNVFVPSAVATHEGAHSTSENSARMTAVHHDSARRFLARKYPGPLLWPIRTSLNVGLAVRSKLISARHPITSGARKG